MENKRGLFIVLEGIDGAGKSSHIQTVANFLKKRYPTRNVGITREPISTPFGVDIHELMRQYPDLSDTTQTLLINAARSHHVETIIRPLLIRGDFIVCDRFSPSTLAYQALDYETACINEFACQDIKPDFVLWLDIEPELACERIQARKGNDANDLKGLIYLKCIRAKYNSIFNFPTWQRFPNCRIDASQSFNEVKANIEKELNQFLTEKYDN